MTEAIESVRAADVGEHRLHDTEPPSVAVPAELAVNLTLHPRGVGFRFTLRAADEQRHLPLNSSVRMS
jgi:hypothetical protein